jgi:hypothetical protein
MRLVDVDGYTLINLDEAGIQYMGTRLTQIPPLNRRYLNALTDPPHGGKLTGTFIYAHPPDYIGQCTMEWGVSEWRALFQWLKEMGLDTVIYQAAAWVEVCECYYPSRFFSTYRTWNSLGTLLEAVAAEGLTLFLGGLGSLLTFDESATAEALHADRDLQLACCHELYDRYAGGFHGFYVSPETCFPGRRQPEREKMLNEYYSAICREVKQLQPELPILFSPATFYYPNRDQEAYDFLFNIFQGCPVDIICPQDSIGVMGNQLEHLPDTFAVWQKVCKAIGAEFWVNAESFELNRTGTTQDFIPADFKRLAVQLAHARQVAQKIVSWEVPYFYSPLAGERGNKLRESYLASLAAGERE